MKEHYFVHLPRTVSEQLKHPTYYPIKSCKRGHTTGRRTKQGSCKRCAAIKDTEYALNNSLSVWFKNKRNSAKLNGIEFNITLDNILPLPDKCPVLDIPLTSYLGKGIRGFYPDSVSLDRINPNKGYVKDNVKVISGRANRLKNNATIEELESIIKYMKDNL